MPRRFKICLSKQGEKSKTIIKNYNELKALNSFQNGLRNPHLRTVVKSNNFTKLCIEEALDNEVSHKFRSNEIQNCKYCGKKEDH